MTSFIKSLLRGNHSKHRKLLEDWGSVEQDAEADSTMESGSSEGDVVETSAGASFSVKYMGSSPVDCPNGKAATAEAIRTVVSLSKVNGKKLQRVIVSVNLRGIKVIDTATNEVQFDISIYRISYCSADAAYNHVFAFIATNLNETMECHAFLCRKKKLAQSATLAIARIFNTAYELWQLSHEDPPADDQANDDPEPPEMRINVQDDDEGNVSDDVADVEKSAPIEENELINENNHLLIDFNEEIQIPTKANSWVLFDEDEDTVPKRGSNILPLGINGKWVPLCRSDSGNSIDLLSLP